MNIGARIVRGTRAHYAMLQHRAAPNRKLVTGTVTLRDRPDAVLFQSRVWLCASTPRVFNCARTRYANALRLMHADAVLAVTVRVDCGVRYADSQIATVRGES